MGKVRGAIVSRADVRQDIVRRAGGEGAKLDKFIRAELAALFNKWVAEHRSDSAKRIKESGVHIEPSHLYPIKGTVDIFINAQLELAKFEKDPLSKLTYKTPLEAIDSPMMHLANLLNLGKN